MSSQTRQQIIAIHIFSNISGGKYYQTMKFDHLIEYKMRNTFFKKSYAKYDGEAIPRPFYKRSQYSIYLDQQPVILHKVYFYCVSKSRSTKIY